LPLVAESSIAELILQGDKLDGAGCGELEKHPSQA